MYGAMPYGEDDNEERADLAARVKQLQRDSEEGKQQWWCFCDVEGFSNRRDPNRHTVEFLRRFFDARREGRIPAGRSTSLPANEADPEMHKIWVGRVKQAQRSSPEQKMRWEKFCDVYGAGIRDPQRHDSTYLRRFFDEVQQGSDDPPPARWPLAEGQPVWPSGGSPMPGAQGSWQQMAGYPAMGYPPMGYAQMGGYPQMGYPQMAGYPMMSGMMPPWMMGGGCFPMGGVPGYDDASRPYGQREAGGHHGSDRQSGTSSKKRSRSRDRSHRRSRDRSRSRSRDRSRDRSRRADSSSSCSR